MYNYKCKWWR